MQIIKTKITSIVFMITFAVLSVACSSDDAAKPGTTTGTGTVSMKNV